ncbi:MAG: ATP-binding protein [Planctomycetota bacterium]
MSKRRSRHDPKRQYKMTVAGQLFKHLGLQMYSGAVPAISELLSNAYDAMARNVWITIPTGRPIQSTDQIVVEDDGHGMTFKECNTLYLSVGRNRRSNSSEWTKAYNRLKPRKVQGRKGIGKLAGFGIAVRIEVRTVSEKQISHFVLDFDALTKSQSFADTKGYAPEGLKDDGKNARERRGTKVTLSQLKISRAIDEDQFKRGIARRLLVLDRNFTVHVNEEAISRQEIPFQFRFPAKVGSWETADLENGQQIQWWAGFCKDTIPEEERRGFVVYVRGKLAQTPWFFDLSGGVWGQHGMQYLTGEVRADFLDESIDLIATDRGTIRWEDPIATSLKDWGRKKIRELLEAWTDKRRQAKSKSPTIIRYLKQAERLPETERKIFKAVVDRICAIPQLDKDKEGKDIANELVEFAYNALTNRSFLDAIRRLNAASPVDLQQFTEVLSEWDIIEAVSTAHLVKGRVAIIRKFAQMIRDKVREKPDMQDYLKQHPWLIDPKWTVLHHEKSLDNVLAAKFKLTKTQAQDGQQRLDFFCLGDGRYVAHVVELKRPGDHVGKKELDKLNNYVYFLKNRLIEGPIDPEKKRTSVTGLLICEDIRDQDRLYAQDLQKMGTLRVWRFEDLLEATLAMHRDYLEVVKQRAPAADPRIQDLDGIGATLLDGSRRTRTKKRAGTKKPLKKKSAGKRHKRSS